MSELNTETINQPGPAQTAQVPACQKCGRQDETLRVVAFPFVFSVVVITFRRNFAGLWCKTHRIQNPMAAGLISSIFGWIGIPSGLFFTPIVLFQLAKGGVQPADTNIQLLAALAEDKLRKGDTAAAVRCLEECLKFQEIPEIKKRLNEIRPRYGVEPEPIGCLRIISAFIGSLIISFLIGVGIGVLDLGSRYSLSLIMANEVPFFVALLAWSPLLAGCFIGCLGLTRTIEQTLLKIRSGNQWLAITLAVISSLSIPYGIFEGNLIIDNICNYTVNFT